MKAKPVVRGPAPRCARRCRLGTRLGHLDILRAWSEGRMCEEQLLPSRQALLRSQAGPQAAACPSRQTFAAAQEQTAVAAERTRWATTLWRARAQACWLAGRRLWSVLGFT